MFLAAEPHDASLRTNQGGIDPHQAAAGNNRTRDGCCLWRVKVFVNAVEEGSNKWNTHPNTNHTDLQVERSDEGKPTTA
jgi:hypothetical protein